MLPHLSPYTVIKGKWNKKSYEVKKKLGEGGTGAVYLVRDIHLDREYALKLSEDNIAINREFGLLKKFQNVKLVVKVYDMDDVEIQGKTLYYLLLEHIDGVNLQNYSENNLVSTKTVLGVIIVILDGLVKIHNMGYIMADLKLENIMLDREKKKIKLIDLGGLVKKGEAIKEFTPSYDRASWNCGDRIAETSYDLFLVIMILVRLTINENLNPRKDTIETVINKIQKSSIHKDIKSFMIKGLLGKEKNIEKFSRRIKELYNKEKQIFKTNNVIKNPLNVDFFFICSCSLFISTLIFAYLNIR
ncbi:protein kinase [Serpentinicella sp. ANB-PHB4]|uniref:protein kinase domain-containing protein n=1 Tax=Serpentinicella sp. ANB-PHB4 TaxID=3074076 RepID=UPI00285D1E38|nr:protein kinase [Serpentinicella sp. ANB-PHB4]MDR5659121.1 protein kinase [Serpentinicella sp. ANB-PHB4]